MEAPRAASGSALLDALFAYAPIGLGFWDTELRCRRINAALAAINGAPAEATLGRTMPEVLGPLGEELERLFRGVLERREPLVDIAVTGETPAQPGVPRHWRATYYPVLSAGGDPLGVAASVVEVTGEREAELRARTATALLDAVVEAAPVGIAFLDLELRYQRVNSEFARLANVDVAAVAGRRPSEVLGAIGAQAEDFMARARDTGEPVLEVELSGELATDPGRTVWRESSYFPVRDAAGAIAGVGGIVRDVTERHRADRERQRLVKDALTARRRAEEAQAVAERARARTEFLADAGRRLAESMDYERTLQEVAQIVVPGLADWCTMVLRQPSGRLDSIALAHADAQKLPLAREMARRWPPRLDAPRGIGAVLRTGEATLDRPVTDAMLREVAQSEEHFRAFRTMGIEEVLTVPLRMPGGLLGAMSLILGDPSRSFSQDDVLLATTLADRAALHIRNAQLYGERSHIARTLQAGLLPQRLPQIPGVELAARYVAAGDQNEVGGDFYDAFAAGEARWAITIGDVVGKGPEAAALTALSRHTLRAAAQLTPAPADSLRMLNRALIAETGANRFCTVIHGDVVLEPGRGVRVRVASGGHPPPRILRAAGAVETVDVRGTLIGWVEDPALAEAELRLAPGDALVLFTDGVVEVRGHGPELGERELVTTLAGLAGAAAETIAETVLRRSVELHGGVAPDDVALLVLRAL